MVEITLIEVAQSVQDDGASAGRRPAKILKPLFNRAAVKKSVTAAPAAVSTTAAAVSKQPTSASVPTAKEAAPAVLPPDAKFDLENLTRAVKLYSQTLPQGGVRAQLFRATPQLLNADTFEIKVDNPAIEAQMRQYLPALSEYVKKALKLPSVKVMVKVVEYNPEAVLSPAQFYAKMKEKNPALAILEKEMQAAIPVSCHQEVYRL